jgi:hypothetical protein
LVFRLTFALATIAPWLMWLDLNAMALRFVYLRGHWPMCETALPCRPTVWADCDSIGNIWDDPVHLLLDPARWQEQLVLWSAPVWLFLWFAVARRLPPTARHLFLGAFVLGWICLIFDPTFAVSWYID